MSAIKTINIKGKQYVEVAERVRLVHELGVVWDDEKALALGKPIADSSLSAQQIGLINADLAKAKFNKAS